MIGFFALPNTFRGWLSLAWSVLTQRYPSTYVQTLESLADRLIEEKDAFDAEVTRQAGELERLQRRQEERN